MKAPPWIRKLPPAPPELRRALACQECGKALSRGDAGYLCLEGWHGKIVPAAVLLERLEGILSGLLPAVYHRLMALRPHNTVSRLMAWVEAPPP